MFCCTQQEIFDRFFPAYGVKISNSMYTLLDYYNEKEKKTDNGILYDLKFVNLLLKAIYGFAAMADIQTPDFTDRKMILAKGIISVVCLSFKDIVFILQNILFVFFLNYFSLSRQICSQFTLTGIRIAWFFSKAMSQSVWKRFKKNSFINK